MVAIHIPKPRRYRVSGPCTPVRGHPSPLQDYIEPLESISNIQYPKLETAEEKRTMFDQTVVGKPLGATHLWTGTRRPKWKNCPGCFHPMFRWAHASCAANPKSTWGCLESDIFSEVFISKTKEHSTFHVFDSLESWFLSFSNFCIRQNKEISPTICFCLFTTPQFPSFQWALESCYPLLSPIISPFHPISMAKNIIILRSLLQSFSREFLGEFTSWLVYQSTRDTARGSKKLKGSVRRCLDGDRQTLGHAAWHQAGWQAMVGGCPITPKSQGNDEKLWQMNCFHGDIMGILWFRIVVNILVI